jgi:hypothetical protein
MLTANCSNQLFEPPLQNVIIGTYCRVFFNIFTISGQGAWGQAWRAGIGVGCHPTGRPAPPPLSLDLLCIVAGKVGLRAPSRQGVSGGREGWW